MKILSVDTSTKKLSLGVFKNNDCIACVEQSHTRSCGSSLVPAISSLMLEAKTDIRAIDLFAIGLGPGSFTGLRVSLSAVKTMAIVLNRPIIGVSSFDAIARNAVEESKKINIYNICVCFDAKQDKAYARFYNIENEILKDTSGFILDEPVNIFNKIKNKTILLGDGVRLYKKYHKNNIIETDESLWYPKAESVAKIAMRLYQNGQRDDAFSMVPLYVYPKECQIKTVNKIKT